MRKSLVIPRQLPADQYVVAYAKHLVSVGLLRTTIGTTIAVARMQRACRLTTVQAKVALSNANI